MCSKFFNYGSDIRTLLFMIVLLSLKLCSPQDLNDEFVNDDVLDSVTDVSVNTEKNIKTNKGTVVSSCRSSELLCDTGQCISLDKYCNGEDDCGDKSDEPKACTPCNRTYMGDVGRTYELEVRRPREDHLPFICNLNFTATGANYGDIIQLTFDTFTVGKFVSFTSDGCPDGHMTIVERSPSPPTGQWCGSAWGYTVYFSESDSINMTLRLDRLSQQGVGYNFDFKLAYKFLRRSEARLRYGNATVGAWRGERVPGTYCDRILTDCDLRACRIQSPNFPGVYPRNATCTYRIEHTKIPADKHVLLAVRQTNSHKIHIKDQIVKYDRSQRVLKIWDQCNVVQDYLTVWDGATRESPVLVRLCGGDAVPDIVSRGPHMLLEFHTSPYDNPFHPVPLSYLPGFELEVQVLYVDKDSHSYVRADGRCRFILRSSDKTSGILRNPRHSLPPNTSCVYFFQGRANEIVWVSFVKYHATGTDPAGFDQQKDCSSQLTIWDGAAPDADLDRKLDMSDKKLLLGSFCREESPRLCDHALLSNATRATRPCAPSESYITTGPALTILQELRQGSALYPVSFFLRYEFVDVSEQGQPLTDSRSACDRVFKSAQTYSGRFQAPRAIFYYGRGGAQNLTCILRFEAKYGERVQLTFTNTYFGNKYCITYKDSRSSRWVCDKPIKRTIGGEGYAQIIITEYPWEGVPIQRDCLCTNRSEPLNIHTLTAPVVEVNFTVTMMNITEDYDDFAFDGEFKFVPTGSSDESICSSGWGERRLRGSSGEIRLYDKRQMPIPPEVIGDRNVISESVRAEVACVHRPWLIEPGGDEVTPLHGRYLYMKLPGFEMSSTSTFCPTPNRIYIYEAHDTTKPKEICPDENESMELFSPGWSAAQTNLESSLKPHARSYVIDFLQHEPADYSIKWIEVMKKSAMENEADSVFFQTSISLECRYKCPELNACIPFTLWCDGNAHCPSGYDEEDSNCSFRISLPPPYVAAVAGVGLLLCAITVALCACRRRRRKEKQFKARLDGALPSEERPYDRVKSNGVAETIPQYATVQKYATLDKYSLSQKYSAGLNDARYYDEVSQRDKLADTRYASLGRGNRCARTDSIRGNGSRRPNPDIGYPDLKDGFC
ncbi:PREDICTED: uncharacterized protein LOC106115808 [Papilio xuthus]|uniref:Uncharacterized protein LOC106115808 n=1 Tax=Papilio xuthus TaxID=66420 RepID=A0AAJ7E6D8_PAPXU|nr:PREDICTED: uncharacterized protein LOC106115808 [Papilio xuthus]